MLAGDYAANEATGKLVADIIDDMFAVGAVAHEACGMMLRLSSSLMLLCNACGLGCRVNRQPGQLKP